MHYAMSKMLDKSRIKSLLRESLRMTFDAIRQNKLRSILTLLGISVGVFSVIGVMTAIRTLETSIESGLNVFGANTFLVSKEPRVTFRRGRRSPYRNRKNIDYEQFLTLKDLAKTPIMVSASGFTVVRSVKYKTNTRIPIYNPECAVIIVGTCINLLFINLEKVGFSSTSTVSMPKRILCSVPYIA